MVDKENALTWLKIYLADMINEPSESFDGSAKLSYFDLDSIDAVTLTTDLEDRLRVSIHPELLLDEERTILAASH